MRKYDDTAVKELIKTVQCGNDEESNTAQKELYEDNTGLIRSVVKRYLNRGTDSEDLFQIGSIGLIKAIRNSTPIRLLSDTMSRFPYKYADDFVIVPCQMGVFRKIFIPGFWTFCFHPNIMDDGAFKEFESFIAAHRRQFVSFDSLPIGEAKNKSLIDRLMGWAYLTLRKLKR